jgi:hypothetical protein
MAILKVQPNAIDTTGNFAVGAMTTTGNINVGGKLIVNDTILPTSANVIDIGSPTMRFGALYLAGNTIDIGGTLITTGASGDLSFTTQSGNVAITANTVSFLSTVANTVTEAGNVAFDGNVRATAVYSDSYFYANGAPFTGARGYSGSAGYIGSKGDTGLGFTIAKSYLSVAALTADTSPTGIVTGQFAIVNTGDVQNAENSRLYLWTGSAYNYVNDLSGAAGITGPAGYTGSASTAAGYTGSAGSDGSAGSAGTAGATGYTGSQGAGYTGSSGTNGYTGSQGAAGNTGTTGYTGSSGTFSGTTSSAIVTTNATSSTSTSTGALQVVGGAGIAGNVYAGSVYTNGLYWSGNGAVMSTGGGSSGGYLNMVMTGAVITPVIGVARLYPPVDMTVTKVLANLSSAPSNGNMTFIIKKNGVSIGTTFTLSTALMTPVTVSVALTTADYLTIDVAGSSAADLRVTLKYV